jgi:hypothetical protein
MKKLNYEMLKDILYRFPNNNIKNLNIYNKSSNNKILFDPAGKYYILKCKGKRSYIWFTYYEKKMLAILILLNGKNIDDKCNDFYELMIEFDNTLCYNNVLLYGYYFKNKINNYFIIENVYNFNILNHIIENKNYNNVYKNKLEIFSKILPLIKTNSNFYIKLPLILENSDSIFKKIYNLDYKIYSIMVYSDYKYLGNYILDSNNFNNSNNFKKIIATFKITANIEEDLYNLFIINNEKELLYDLALINSYKTSIFMNNIFRNIKENKNLDLLEESDSDEEFENINSDKFVNLEKSINFDCEYNNKFKKWVPLKLSNNKIISKKELEFNLGKKIIFT